LSFYVLYELYSIKSILCANHASLLNSSGIHGKQKLILSSSRSI
jgi:hypothetical protein